MGEGLYREAVARLGRTKLRPDLARSHPLYGEWLRREHRRVDAHAQLRADELASQERHIAQLFLSPRTVEWHLRKVFTKLEIHSRHEVSNALPSSESELARHRLNPRASRPVTHGRDRRPVARP
jgi:hypothetical protein